MDQIAAGSDPAVVWGVTGAVVGVWLGAAGAAAVA